MMASFAERRPRGARLLAIGAVAALTIGVGVLSALALQHGAAVPESTRAPSIAPAPVLPSVSPSAAPSASTPPPVAEATSAERFLAVRDNGIVWRGLAGVCGETPATIERSTDAGATWRAVTPPQLAGGQLLSLATFGEPDADVVGAGADCVPAGFRTFTDGAQWATNAESISLAAYAPPSTPGSVATPAGTFEAPCAKPTNMRTSRGEVGLICEGTAYFLSGEEWVELAANAIALDALAGQFVVAHADSQCVDGVAISEFTADVPRLLGCIDGAPLTSPAALSVVSAETVLWSGDGLFRL